MTKRFSAAAWAVMIAAMPLPGLAQEAENAPLRPAPATYTPPQADIPMPPVIAPADFARQSEFGTALLSPDGSMIAIQAELPDRTAIAFLDVASRQAVKRLDIAENLSLEWFQWAGNGRLIFSLSEAGVFGEEEVRYTRLMVFDLATNEQRLVGDDRSRAVDGDNVIYTDPDGEYVLLSVQRVIFEYPSVYRVDLDERGKRDRVQLPRDGVWNWVADAGGTVRAGLGWHQNRLRIWYRSDAQGELELIGKLREGDTDGFYDISRIVSGSDEGYALWRDDGGRVALVRMNFVTREPVATIYRNDDWDVDEALFDDDGEPLAVRFTDDRDRIVWLDEDMARLQRQIDGALREQEKWIVSHAESAGRMLVWAGGEDDPGGLYLFDAGERRMIQLAEYRPELIGQTLAKPVPVSYTARDGTRIAAYLTVPAGRPATGLPLIIMPHGGPYGIRDRLAYDDEVQLLANHGYAVLQPNFRGSGGYGREFEQLGNGQMGRKMQDDLDDAMDWAVAQGIAEPGRVCLMGGSYGGYAAMWGLIRNPERYACAISFAGPSDLDRQLRYDRQSFTRKGARRWVERVEGEDFDLARVSPAEQAENLSRPLLIAHGKDDTVVPYSQFRRMERATRGSPFVTALTFEGEGHGLQKEESRQRWYAAVLDFLARHNPPDPR